MTPSNVDPKSTPLKSIRGPGIKPSNTLNHIGVIVDTPLFQFVGPLIPRPLKHQRLNRIIKDLILYSKMIDVKTLSIWPIAYAPIHDFETASRKLNDALAEVCESVEMDLQIFNSEQDFQSGLCTRPCVKVFLSFNGKQQVVQAIRGAIAGKKAVPLKEGDIDGYFKSAHSTAPDLIIRTARTKCMEGFMLWQSVRSEYWFHESLLPFSRRHFNQAIRDYFNREKRHGA